MKKYNEDLDTLLSLPVQMLNRTQSTRQAELLD